LTILSAYHTIKTPRNVDNRHIYANLSSVAESYSPLYLKQPRLNKQQIILHHLPFYKINQTK